MQDMLQKYITNMVIDRIAKATGLPTATLQTIAQKALPLITGAIEKNAQDSAKKDGIFAAIRDDHDGSIFNHIEDLMADPNNGKGGKILSHLFGGKEGALEDMIAQSAHADKAQTKNAVEMLAPLVMGALGKEQSDGKLELGDVLGMVHNINEKQSKESGVDMQKALAFLDADGDGSVMDEIMGFMKS